ncbi:MAG: hypothetical protein HY329_05490, partial [Chloroflexi bacterium]|nr:hypothetical protein [Chloroflexota bacterium]
WDIERRRYPQYDHTAVIIAEDITSRFLNVMSLFNGTIPLIALQMQALKIGDQVALVFTTVPNELRLGLDDDDDEVAEVTDRAYWEKRGNGPILSMVDRLQTILQQLDGNLTLKYNKVYIGLAKGGVTNNFVRFRPKKEVLRVEIRIEQSPEIEEKLEQGGLEGSEYDQRRGRYKIRLLKGDLEKTEPLLTELLEMAYKETLE